MSAEVARPVVGFVGAGQLARMAQQAAIALGVDLYLLAETAEDSAAQVVPDVLVGDYRKLADLRRLAVDSDVITFDHELTDPAHLAALGEEGRVVRPAPGAKRFAQDKAYQRRELAALGLPVPCFAEVATVGDVAAFGASHGWPLVLKAPRGGYDGRGVFVVADADEAAAVLSQRAGSAEVVPPMLAEELVPLDRELAMLVARRPGGEAVVYPAVETVQVDGVLRESIAPAPIAADLAEEARALALRIAEAIDLTGVLAVELFEARGALLVNELACRPHNSGHWTIEGATTSQFANHLRAALDWPLGSTTPLAPAVVTVNVLGRADGFDPVDGMAAALAVPGANVHLYGKSTRPGRKLGHVTVLGDDVADARDRARAAAAALGAPMPTRTEAS
jgi:5-(carboxyamino)imidazole ribonucleotide synthase